MKYLITESQYIRIIESQEKIDSILDKMSDGGYESLTIDEKRYLKNYSDHMNKGGRPEEFVDPTEKYDEREGEVFTDYISRLPVQFTFSEESTDGDNIYYYGELKFDEDEYLGVIITDLNGYFLDFDFYSLLSDEDVRLKDKVEGIEHEFSMFFSENVIPQLRGE